jgi:hypothetical protein
MNADGGAQTNLSSNNTDDGLQAWSPDGTKIAFGSFRGGNSEVITMNVDGSAQTNLTNNAANDGDPNWQPTLRPTPQINITNLGQYALPKACFQVENGLDFVPLFHVCDNDFQGAPDASSVCAGDGVCEDENASDGAVVVTVLPGSYVVSESTTPPQHSPPIAAQLCDASAGACALTFVNTPYTRPWHPWDITGPNGVPDGYVRIQDILVVVQHYFQDKPLN